PSPPHAAADDEAEDEVGGQDGGRGGGCGGGGGGESRRRSRQPVPDAAQLAVVPYVEDIDRYLRSLEAEQTRRPMINYVQEIQGGIINMDVRGILVDWMADVAYVFNLQEETLHHAVSYVDRFLSKIAFPGDKLKLLGTTALFVASKYEEIHPPHVRNFSAVTVNTYTTQQVSKMELDILRFLNFDVGSPTVITFLRKFLTSCCGGNNSSNRKLELMCNYLAELSLLDDYYIRFLPSIVAAACLFVGKFTLNPNTRPWNLSVQRNTGYKVSDIEDCIHAIHDLQAGRKWSNLKAVRIKYKDDEARAASSISLLVVLHALMHILTMFCSRLFEHCTVWVRVDNYSTRKHQGVFSQGSQVREQLKCPCSIFANLQGGVEKYMVSRIYMCVFDLPMLFLVNRQHLRFSRIDDI
ncbi:Os03g0208700, partial [Oryza sativa Japonica Group]